MTGEIEKKILFIRGQRVIVDVDLAALYGVTTKRLREQLRRNLERFPYDFMFQLDNREKNKLAAKCGEFAKLKYSRTCPYVFTEHGVIMVASVLSSRRAVEVSIMVVRVFVRLRAMLAGHKLLSDRLSKLETQLIGHDDKIEVLINVVRKLMLPAETKSKRPIGFASWGDK